MKDFLKDRKKVTQIQRLEILLAGQVQIPKMICMKMIQPDVPVLETSQMSDKQLIPLCIKNTAGQHKFRIPFKNTGEQDIEVEFSFHKVSQAVNRPALIRSNSSGTPDLKSQSPIDFSINHTPSIIKIPAHQGPVMINVIAKLKNSYQLDISQDQSTALKRANSIQDTDNGDSLVETSPKRMDSSNVEKYNHLLIATVKDTQIMFSFYVEASIIEADKNSPTPQ